MPLSHLYSKLILLKNKLLKLFIIVKPDIMNSSLSDDRYIVGNPLIRLPGKSDSCVTPDCFFVRVENPY